MSLHDQETLRFFPTYKRLPLEIARGEGVHLIATDGTRYLDMFAGLAVNALGYGHRKVLDAIREQSQRYIHLSNYFLQEPQIRLADILHRQSGFSRVFFANSGTEAVEGALKIARKWGSTRGKKSLVGFSNGFHGRTMGALSIMDKQKYREGFEPFLAHCRTIAFNDPGALMGAVDAGTAAVILECIQGEGGVRPVTQEFADAISALQKQFGFLLIADEIQSGAGRTGTFFAFQHYGLRPDIVTMAKPIGGGLPLGAILGGHAVQDVLQPGTHGTTFGGNPVACAAGIAVLTEIEERGLMKNAEQMGAALMSGFETLMKEFPALIREVRGKGLMLGIDLHRDGDPIVDAMRERRILINCTDRTVLRFLPPLVIGREDVDQTIAALRNVFHSLR